MARARVNFVAEEVFAERPIRFLSTVGDSTVVVLGFAIISRNMGFAIAASIFDMLRKRNDVRWRHEEIEKRSPIYPWPRWSHSKGSPFRRRFRHSRSNPFTLRCNLRLRALSFSTSVLGFFLGDVLDDGPLVSLPDITWVGVEVVLRMRRGSCALNVGRTTAVSPSPFILRMMEVALPRENALIDLLPPDVLMGIPLLHPHPETNFPLHSLLEYDHSQLSLSGILSFVTNDAACIELVRR